MNNVRIDDDELMRMKMSAVNAPHVVNALILEGQESIRKGGRVIVTTNGGSIELESARTPEELTAFISKHFPKYVEELNTAGRSRD